MVDDAPLTPPTESAPTPEVVPEPQAVELAAASSVTASVTPPPVTEPTLSAAESSEVKPREIVAESAARSVPATPSTGSGQASHSSAGARMRAGVQAKKHARLERIVTLAAEKRVITNDDVEKLLKVSDATATNYLRELVRAGRLRRSGVRAGTKYEPI